MYVYALNQLLIGLLVNRYGGRRVILPGALLFCLGSFWFPCSSGSWVYVARALTGFGASALYLSLISETIRSFRKNYTIAVSLVIMNCGCSLSPGAVRSIRSFSRKPSPTGFRSSAPASTRPR